ncbi:fimbrial protein [Citrobacter freundii]|nr:fimbrial protein [Citrobacter freundii]QLW76140.1 fimbrial protein [Citrobacter freundii]
MNKLSIAAAAIVCALGSASAFADDVGLITFDGAVTDTTCTITTNNGVDANNVTITMPVVKVSEVEGATTDTGGVGSKEFELHLSGCPTTLTKASATFTSQQFAELSNGTLKTDPSVAGHADNVSLALYNNGSSNADRIEVGLPANNTQTATLDEGVGVLAYRVAYVPSADWVKGTADITAGKVSSNATFTMSYE